MNDNKTQEIRMNTAKIPGKFDLPAIGDDDGRNMLRKLGEKKLRS